MKINKGKLNNVNKKIFAIGLTFVLIPTVFTGCTKKGVNYIRNEEGYIQGFEGNVTYEYLSHCYFAKIKNNITKEEYYTILKYSTYGEFQAEGYDIFTYQDIVHGNFNYEIMDLVTSYLNTCDMIKKEYNEEELYWILEQFEMNYDNKTKKVLVKE